MLSPITKLLLVLVLPLLILNESRAQTSSNRTKSGEVKRGQGLYQALKDVSIDNGLSLELINSLRDEVEFSKLKVGDKLEATFNQDKKLVEFTFSQNPVEKHILKLNQETGKWDYSFKEEKTFWFTRILEGNLNAGSTLQEDLLAQGLNPSVVNEVVNVLLLKVNFRMNARVGDRFKVLLSERKFKNSIIQTKVLYTSYKGNRAGFHEAYYYEDEERSSTYTAHYTKDGQALISSGLRYPLSRLHVRSGFGWRRHPVTGRRAMHRGVDLRGRSGTPVHSVADGRVVEASYNQFAGNKVAIRHRDGSRSYYYHLAKRSVRKGDWVRSYQVIGTVGATGRVTGPHLHFGFRTPKGSWMNPLNKRMIATPKLTGQRLQNLKKQIADIRSLMTDLEISKVAKYLLQDIPNLKVRPQFDWDFSNVYKTGQSKMGNNI
jgi:murein DD-endopeptidase MepM/ murein hydrolase activator NlpD